jgi:hypothetical protein
VRLGWGRGEVLMEKDLIMRRKVFVEVPVGAFFVLLKHTVFSILNSQYPNIRAESSLEEESMDSETRSRLQIGPPREWVSFFFEGYNRLDLHLGIVLDKKKNSIVIGIHISKKLWPIVQEKVTKIPWKEYRTLKPKYLIKEELDEHQFVEPEITFEMSNMGVILQELIDKAIIYYRAVSKSLG